MRLTCSTRQTQPSKQTSFLQTDRKGTNLMESFPPFNCFVPPAWGPWPDGHDSPPPRVSRPTGAMRIWPDAGFNSRPRPKSGPSPGQSRRDLTATTKESEDEQQHCGNRVDGRDAGSSGRFGSAGIIEGGD